MVERSLIKKILRGFLFIILLIVYYFLYMQTALEQYAHKKTTISESKEEMFQIKSPDFVVCLDPPFKTSFFKEHGMNKSSSAERFFWALPIHWQKFENHFPDYDAIDIYMNMSYKLGLDWQILLPYAIG